MQLAGARSWDRYKAIFGFDLPSTVWNKSSYIGKFDAVVQISDIMSNADTENGVLGDYAGKGIVKDVRKLIKK